MKIKRTLFIVFGWLFILFNALGYPSSIAKGEAIFAGKGIPYILGYNIFFMIGFAFLFMASRQKRKMREQNEKEVLDGFLVDESVTEDRPL